MCCKELFTAFMKSFRLIVGHLCVYESQNKSITTLMMNAHSPVPFNVLDDLTSSHVSADVGCDPGIVPVNSVSWFSRELSMVGFVQLT
jgi:hypothetical protein